MPLLWPMCLRFKGSNLAGLAAQNGIDLFPLLCSYLLLLKKSLLKIL